MSLEDFDGFLSQSFVAEKFANDLLLATNNVDDDNLDILTSPKRLSFDIKELQDLLARFVSSNSTRLVTQLSHISELKKTHEGLNVRQINSSFKRLKNDFIIPYDDALKLYSALKRIHATSNLLRNASYYVFLLQQLESIFDQNEFDKPPFNDLVKFTQISTNLDLHVQDASSLMSLQLVKDYQPVHRKRTVFIVDIASTLLSQITADSSKQSIANICFTLATLADNNFLNCIQSLLDDYTSKSSQAIVKTLTSPKTIVSSMEKVSHLAKAIYHLSKYMQETPFPKLSQTYDQYCQEKLNYNSDLFTHFWRQVALFIGPKFRETISRGGPVAKALKKSSQQYKLALTNGIIQSGDDITENSIPVTMMINAIRVLNG
ncbi:Conserved oligomeric Golgi complex subunit 5 [Komagataella phaffii CBS 7435]|uniref:Conserved oligomeric Golgi complex subunit 5 n=2 Tax=Komagataella phaffii TaxID=460519 RepID=C4R528_KOMPG|nr:uncharacterized protein PAS_chr3_1202 [Komagataella phaffii GS115]AOA63427.1 GQ67_03696T0 [Komagataella phaffii]CAH2449565.1 Conserved oligomeric Golgi complex subunit 5 [Komagataella phaffii CBS 7435]AOA68200.1 GQ68_03668T0 [Komagataella phaffii GS115]CAY70664.1 hypothetical protein PAS_chr3_1202 [Komagataella phaffii GS115]CCA39545.2 Conserved oligomeric Golgi complex subunit 5 [Komagataella phaffii CBS 7435]